MSAIRIELMLPHICKEGPVIYDGMQPCWIWSGYRDREGYGHYSDCSHRQHSRRAHRDMWEYHNGPIPPRMCILHRCDVPSCVNPDHLFMGTHLDNIADRQAKGRSARGDRNASRKYPELRPRGATHHSHLRPEVVARGDRHGSRIHIERRPRGSGHANAKITEADVAWIRASFPDVPVKEIALKFKIGKTTVRRIINRESWYHIP